VNKAEEKELTLYNKVRNVEYSRQKQEQNVRRLQNQLLEAKRQNAAKLQVEMAELSKTEMEIYHKLQREQAELAKVNSNFTVDHNGACILHVFLGQKVFLI